MINIMSGEKMNQKVKAKNKKEKIRIGILHGAITNAGDFLIYERGKKLLENFFDERFDLIYIERFKHFSGDFDGLIILGGPLISRKIHNQSKNIREYIKNKNIPIFCVSLGISGQKFDFENNYFLDNASVSFWKQIYESSKLFSVRDKITYKILNNYGIKTELTGCCALFNLKNLENENLIKNKKDFSKIAVTVPNLSVILPVISFSSVKNLLLTLYFLFKMKKEFNKKEIGLFFQHGYKNFTMKFIKKIANILDIKTYDISGKSLDSFKELCEYDVHIGTRLHTHLYFLSSNKSSFLFNIDMRTEAFLKTIETPSEAYTLIGIKNLVNTLKEKIAKNNFNEFNNVPDKIREFYIVMKNFLNKIVLFYKEYDNYV
ncbi:MAG TPA: polysaccharide pyruvyl transferase family protein, partial [Candidatus Atribacteria bacterium]|nr:polysaccharide pyruvyl transferase family protein [Candidatus Atribacteria bacterium]